MVFKQVGSDTDKLIAKFGLLNKSFANIKTDMINGHGLRSFVNIVSQKDIDNFAKFNQELNRGTSYHKAFNNHLSKSHTYVQQQALAVRELKAQNHLLDRQRRTGQITQEKYHTALAANKAQIQKITASTQKLTLAQKASTVVSKALGTALNLAMNIGVMTVINLIITGITKLVNKQKELREEIKANADEARETIKNISDLYLQYRQLSEDVKTNTDLKDDLSNTTYNLLEALGYEKTQIDELTAGYQNLDDAINQATLDSLKKAADSLNLDVGVKFDELQDVFEDKLFSTSDDDMYIFSTWNPWNEQRSQNKKMFQALLEADLENVDIGRGINYEELLVGGHEKTLDDFKKTAETYAKILEILRNNSGVSAEELGKNDLFIKIKNRYDDLTTAIDNYSSSVKDYNNNIAQQTVLTSLIGKDIPKTSEEFEKFKETLVSSAQNSNQFIGSAEEIEQSIISILKTMPEFANFFAKSSNTATNSVTVLKTAIEDLKSAFDEVFDKQSTIQSALDKIAEGTSLSAEEMLKIVDLCPELANAFHQTVNGWTIAAQDLIGANDNVVQSTKESIQEQIKLYEAYLEQLKLEEARRVVSSKGYVPTEALKGNLEFFDFSTLDMSGNEEFKQTEDAIAGLKLYLEVLGVTFDETGNKINNIQEKYKELTNSVSDFTSNQKTLNDTLEEQKEHGQLSASTIQSLTEAGYAQALAIDAETSAVTLNVTEYERLNAEKKKQIQLDIAKLELDLLNPHKEEALAIADLERSLSSLNAEERKATQIKIAQMRASLANKKLTDEEIEQKEQELKFLEAQLAILNAPTDFDEETPTEIQNFLNGYEKYQHEINMGLKAKDQEYFDWVAQESEKAYSKYPEYLKDLWKYQEEVYEGRKQLADDYLNDRIEDREAQIEITLNTSKADDGTKLNTKEKFDYVRACYKEILAEIETRINDLIQSGVATNSEAIQELEKQYQEFADKLDGVLTDEIEPEIDYLKNMQDEWDKFYDDKIDTIEKEKSAMEERYDSEIEALQKTNDEKQKEYDIEKARQELEKASQKTRKVYSADGTVGYRQDTEAVAEAQKNLNDLLIEKQIEALEEQKELETEKFDKQIELLEQEQTAKQDFYNKLLEILENYLNPKTTESNSNVWESVLGDTENVKATTGNVEVKGVDVDTSDLKRGILTTLDISTWLEKLGAKLDIVQDYKNGNGNTTTTVMTTSVNTTASHQFDSQHKNTAWSANRDDYTLNSGNHSENITYTIGDIHIHKPVGNSDDLARELKANLPIAADRIIYSNLK